MNPSRPQGFARPLCAAIVVCSLTGVGLATHNCWITVSTGCCNILTSGALEGYSGSGACPDGTPCFDVFITNPAVQTVNGVQQTTGWDDINFFTPANCTWRDYACVQGAMGTWSCNPVGTTTRACFPSAAAGKACNPPDPAG